MGINDVKPELCHMVVSVPCQDIQVKDDCSFYWYWWNFYHHCLNFLFEICFLHHVLGYSNLIYAQIKSCYCFYSFHRHISVFNNEDILFRPFGFLAPKTYKCFGSLIVWYFSVPQKCYSRHTSFSLNEMSWFSFYSSIVSLTKLSNCPW